MLLGKSKKTEVDTNPAKVEEILTRGVENIFPNKDFLKSKLSTGTPVKMYLGIDPTGPTLHLGHIIPLKKMGAMQKLGHKIILLIGDFTAMIGDPTDKTATRKKLTRKEVLKNCALYKKQAEKFISFDGPNKAELRFNSEWMDKLSYLESLEIAPFFTVDQLLKRDMFRKREEEGKPVYLHEIQYPMMQAYDSVMLDVDGEIGGNDQTFNMLAGRDLIRSMKNKEKFVIAMKLLADTSGKKMGKTENNMVAMDQTPEDIFGKVMSWTDEMIIPGFEIATDVPLSKVEEVRTALSSGSNPKGFKVELAKEIVSMCYDRKKADEAEKNFEKTFAKGQTPEDVIEKEVAKDTLLVDVLMGEKIVDSKTEWRRLVVDGAVSTTSASEDWYKITDVNQKVSNSSYKIGKRRFIKIKIK